MIITKNNFNWGKIFFFLHILLLSSCNITYKVRSQNNELESIHHSLCGNITIELVGKGNSKFVLRQRFDLGEKVIVNIDSLHIYYNKKEIIVQHKLKNEKNSPTEVELGENDIWEASFELDKGVFEGDTITIFGPAYVQCNNQVITLDSMFYSFSNRLRIHGVNYY